MRTLRIYSLNNLPIYHTAVLASLHVETYIPNTYCLFCNWKFVCFDHLPPILSSTTFQSVFFFEMQLMILLLEKNFVVFMLQFPSLQFVLT